MLLDTCGLLWLAQGGGNLSAKALEKIDRSPVVFISAITGFEVALKWKSGKLRLPAQPEDWFTIVVEHHNLDVLPLTLSICRKAAVLPPYHKDPCDRFIIATAMEENMVIVTGDVNFAQYGVEVVS